MIRGLVIPVCLAAYGLYCLLSGRGFIVGNPFRALGGAIDVHGAAATALAISCFGLAAFFHFRWFWRDRRMLWRLAGIGQAAGALVWLTSWLYVIWYLLSSGRIL